jgi:hypothetical protein
MQLPLAPGSFLLLLLAALSRRAGTFKGFKAVTLLNQFSVSKRKQARPVERSTHTGSRKHNRRDEVVVGVCDM